MKIMNFRLTALKDSWRMISGVGTLLVITALLVGYRLGSLTGGLSPAELDVASHYKSLSVILSNPLHAPYNLLGWVISQIPYHSQAMVRLPAALLGIASLIPLAYILRRWYGMRMTLLGMALFMTSAWFLHVSRVGLYEAEYLWAICSLLGLHLLLHAEAERFWVFLTWLIGMLVLLFIPGMVWLVLVNIILQRNDILDAWEEINLLWRKLLILALPLLTIVALAYVFYLHSSLFIPWLGAPDDWSKWLDMLKRFGNAFAYFVLRGPLRPDVWLGRLPILDAFVLAMLVAGGIFYSRHLKAARTRLIITFFLLGAILVALQPTVGFSLLVPIVYLVAVAGIAYLLHEWLGVFPRNPLARGVGIGIISLLVAVSCIYNLRSYFVAWPHNIGTKHTFTQHLQE
jgi:hypothetical protein